MSVSVCVCVSVCVLLPNPLKNLPFFPPYLIDVGSGLDVCSIINMSICGQTLSC